jgi:DNA-binding transcriptional LysR family regulator
MRASVLAGMGIGYSPTWLFDEELASGEVQHLLPDWEAAAIPIHLVSPRERRHSAKVNAFAEYVAQAMGGGQPSRMPTVLGARQSRMTNDH